MSDYEDSGYDYSSNEDFDAVLARHQRRAVKRRFDDACMLCGYPDPEVAPILAKRNVRHVRTLRSATLATVLHSMSDLFRSKPYEHGRSRSQPFPPMETRTSSAVR